MNALPRKERSTCAVGLKPNFPEMEASSTSLCEEEPEENEVHSSLQNKSRFTGGTIDQGGGNAR